MNSQYLQHYRALGIHPGCSVQDLKTAYRRQVRRWHPDHERDADATAASHDRIAEITTAYRVLSEYYKQHGCLPLEAQPDDHLDTSDPNSHTAPDYGEHAEQRPFASAAAPPTRTGDAAVHKSNWRRGLRAALVAVLLGLAYWTIHDWPHDATIMTESTVLPTTTDGSQSVDQSEQASGTPTVASIAIGSTAADVYAIQGAPSKIEGSVWHYGNAKIYFHRGRVIKWESDAANPLSAAENSAVSRTPPYFTVGSTKDEVKLLQGSPLIETENVWDYGLSKIYFADGHVTHWTESPMRPLKVRRH